MAPPARRSAAVTDRARPGGVAVGRGRAGRMGEAYDDEYVLNLDAAGLEVILGLDAFYEAVVDLPRHRAHVRSARATALSSGRRDAGRQGLAPGPARTRQEQQPSRRGAKLPRLE